MSLAPGLIGEADTVVTEANMASAVGSGGVEVFDDVEKIFEGLHERAIVRLERFLARVAQKGLS